MLNSPNFSPDLPGEFVQFQRGQHSNLQDYWRRSGTVHRYEWNGLQGK